MTEHGSDKPLVIPIRTPREAPRSRGSVERLWAEFTDPGPAGDAPVFLKKYADGFGPGCMGLVFMTVGLLMMVLFSRQIDMSQKKTLLPLAFGAVFALAGFSALVLGIKTVIGKSGAPVPRSGEPWTSDNDWDPRGARPEGEGSGFSAFVGRFVFFVFIGLLNLVWRIRMDLSGIFIVGIVVGLFDLVALAVLVDSIRKAVQAVRVGTTRLVWRRFPFFTGGRFEAVFQTARPMRPTGPPQATLRRIEQRNDVDSAPGRAAGMHAYEAWSSTTTLAALAGEPVASLPIGIDVPAAQPGTDLSKDECTYWQLLVSVPVAGPDVEATFLVPIYERPK